MEPTKKNDDSRGPNPPNPEIEIDLGIGGTDGDEIADAQRWERDFDVEGREGYLPREPSDDDQSG